MIEKQEPPQWVVDRVNLLGGFNIYGKPNYRVIWGGNRFHFVGGMFKHVVEVSGPVIGTRVGVVTEVPELRSMLAYHPQRWHLERWRSPDFYGTREEWYANTWDEDAKLHRMGDYPTEGDYEHVFYLAECVHMKEGDAEWCVFCKASSGSYIPLEENMHMIEWQIDALRRSENVTEAEEKTALFLREDKKRQVRNKLVAERVQNALRPRLATQPTSWQEGTNSRTSVPEPKINPDVRQPLGRSAFRQSNIVLPGKKQEEIT
jgi:hypothetical protein